MAWRGLDRGRVGDAGFGARMWYCLLVKQHDGNQVRPSINQVASIDPRKIFM